MALAEGAVLVWKHLIWEGVKTGLVAVRATQTLCARVERKLGETALRRFDSDELSRLTASLYDRPMRRVGLFRWEQEWFAESLPSPPASILVGGAGRGREVEALRLRGYRVLGFDPVARHANACPGVLVGGYGDLVGASTKNADFRKRVVAETPYDAILLGWTSFNHVQPAQTRRAVLVVLKTMTRGPILVSFLARNEDCGRREPAEEVTARHGFAHRFAPREFEHLAEDAGFEKPLIDFKGGFPHATLRSKAG